jgi:hypothetical protein
MQKGPIRNVSIPVIPVDFKKFEGLYNLQKDRAFHFVFFFNF